LDPIDVAAGPDIRKAEAPVRQDRRPVLVRGRVEPLSEVPFHADGPLTRWLMAGRTLHPDMDFHIAIHRFDDVEPGARDYCHPHVHEVDEINVFHSDSRLRVDVQLDDETILVEAPATLFVPAGVRHAANVRSGSGMLVVILLRGEFKATGSRP